MLNLTVEIESEEDGRWLAEVIELPGAMAYGDSPARAVASAKAVALRTLADQIEHGELPSHSLDSLRFEEREPVAF